MRGPARRSPVLVQRAVADSPRLDTRNGRPSTRPSRGKIRTRAAEITLAASLNVRVGEESGANLVWPVSHLSSPERRGDFS